MTPPAPITAEVMLRHADSLRALARGLLGDEAAAEDVVQETWLAAMERPPRSHAGIGGWLHVAARHLALKRGRSDAGRAARELAVAKPERVESTANLVAKKAALRHVVDAVLALDEPYQSVVFLRYFEDVSPPEIARRLERPEATVRSQLHRGLARLRGQLDVDFEGDRGRWMGAVATLTGFGESARTSLAPISAARGWGIGKWLGALLVGTNVKIAIVAGGVLAAMLTLWNVDEVIEPVAAIEPAAAPAAGSSRRSVRPPSLPVVPVAAEVVDAPRREVATTKPEPVPEEIEPIVEVVPEVLPRIKRIFKSDWRLKLESITVGGSPMSPGSAGPGIDVPEIELWIEREVAVTDEFFVVGFGGGRPGLRRTFDRIQAQHRYERPAGSQGLGVGGESWSAVGTSELTGATVLFAWDPVDHRYRLSFDEDDGERSNELLSDLRADMDLGALAVRGGSIDPKALAPLFGPGGDLSITYKNQGAFEGAMALTADTAWIPLQAVEEARGSVRASSGRPKRQPRGHSGLYSSELEVELELAWGVPFPIPSELAKNGSVAQGDHMLCRVEQTIVGTGRYEWQLGKESVTSLVLDVEVELVSRIDDFPMPGQGPEGVSVVAEYSGTGKLTIDTAESETELEQRARERDERREERRR